MESFIFVLKKERFYRSISTCLHLIILLLTRLVSNRARSLAGWLARCLAFATSTFFHWFFQVFRCNCFNVFHLFFSFLKNHIFKDFKMKSFLLYYKFSFFTIYAQVILAHYEVKAIILFGSYAKGTNHKITLCYLSLYF